MLRVKKYKRLLVVKLSWTIGVLCIRNGQIELSYKARNIGAQEAKEILFYMFSENLKQRH